MASRTEAPNRRTPRCELWSCARAHHLVLSQRPPLDRTPAVNHKKDEQVSAQVTSCAFLDRSHARLTVKASRGRSRQTRSPGRTRDTSEHSPCSLRDAKGRKSLTASNLLRSLPRSRPKGVAPALLLSVPEDRGGKDAASPPPFLPLPLNVRTVSMYRVDLNLPASQL